MESGGYKGGCTKLRLRGARSRSRPSSQETKAGSGKRKIAANLSLKEACFCRAFLHAHILAPGDRRDAGVGRLVIGEGIAWTLLQLGESLRGGLLFLLATRSTYKFRPHVHPAPGPINRAYRTWA